MTCGNGGSAADALHIVGELMKAFVLPRALDGGDAESIREVSPNADYLIQNLQGALPAISLVSETALGTAYANDVAPDLDFAQQVFGYGRPGDILFAISTSGNSKNVLYASEVARAKKVKVIALTGAGGGKLQDIADILIAVPETVTFKIQELHLPIYHAYCLAIENEFFGQ
jgi:D-sedoheptulose 7-phosphate isomerase